ncbi:MAG TPA: bifunctional 4-hydroxy-2-oxoglutarate aldolase/2-dehydro-3-deoxy-phosphogluconate aldolase [Ignavibacteriaceae bacterium]|nr:bifunctional 4-hydroxy-2-oxoglutarate aldolase/2-dehydro-3-deoxy-phosphogluconate aldolase [Ignavibacteriaceae bacterium]
MSRSDVINKIVENGAVAVIRLKDGSKFNKIAEALYAGGVASIELTMTTPDAFKLLEEASKIFSDKMMLGMGSVLNPKDAQRAIDVGAKYIVSPVFKKEILQTAHTNNTAAMPGCFSPTEIQTAYEEGADIIKVFPADIVGMAFFKAIKAPLPHLKLMPTGGVSLTNAGDWLKTGACAVGIGSALLNQKAIDENKFSVLTENAKILMQSINSAKL